MINLCLVVIATQFSETKKRETERMMQERKRFNSSSTLASNSEPGGCYEEILKYLSHLFRRARRKLNRIMRRVRGRRQRRVNPERAISLRRKRKKKKGTTVHLHHHHHHHHHHYHISNTASGSGGLAPRASPEVSDIDAASCHRRPTLLSVPSDTLKVPGSGLSAGSTDSIMADSHSPNLLKSLQSSPCPQPLLTASGSAVASWNEPNTVSLLTVPNLATTRFNLSDIDLHHRRSSEIYNKGKCRASPPPCLTPFQSVPKTLIWSIHFYRHKIHKEMYTKCTLIKYIPVSTE